MTEQKKLKKKNLFNLYVVTAVVVYVELYILPTLLFPVINSIIPTDYYSEFVKPDTDIFFFFVILSCLILGSRDLASRERIKIPYVALHLLLLGVFSIYLSYLVNIYPFPALNKDGLLIRIAHIFNEGIVYFTGRFRFGFLFISGACHYTLFLAYIRDRKVYVKYFLSTMLGFFIAEIADVFSFLQDFLIGSVSKGVSLLLTFSGWQPFFSYVPGKAPVLGTEFFKVTIVYGCSGVQGLSLFLFVFTAAVFNAGFKEINKFKGAFVLCTGMLFMYCTNVLRIYLIILIGHFTGSPDMAEFFHVYGSVAIYLIAVALIIVNTYHWMLKPSSE